MESVVGGDLAQVVVHTDTAAADRAGRAGALAVTSGVHVDFASGAYRPGTPVGDALLAHELAHVRHQDGGARAAPLGVSPALELEADRAAVVAGLRLLAPNAALALRPPSLSSGRGLGLQACAPRDYLDIRALPSREDYERRGELQPREWETIVEATQASLDPAVPRLDLGPLQSGGVTGRSGTDEEPARSPVLAEPWAPAPTTEQLLARLTTLEARHQQIAAATSDLTTILHDDSGAILIPPITFAVIRQDLLNETSGLAGSGPLVLGASPGPPWTAQRVAGVLPRTEQVQQRTLDALGDLAAVRDREQRIHAPLTANGYDLAGALAEIDTVRWDYARAAADYFGEDQAALLDRADAACRELNRRLLERLVGYYQQRRTSGTQIAGPVADMQAWAREIGVELARLASEADDIAAADRRGDPDVGARRRKFAREGQLVATSLDALGEWDVALSAYQMLEENTAAWGQEAVQRIAWRLDQMKDAWQARDEPYLRLLVRDHRADKAVADFYASIPDIIKNSHLIIGFVVLLVVCLATAGVGAVIGGVAAGMATTAEAAALAGGAGATTAAAEASVILEAGMLAKIGGEALVFTSLHYGLLSLIPGMAPTSSFLEELVWNLALFGVLHGVGSLVEGALKESTLLRGLSAQARLVVGTGVRMGSSYAVLQTYGLIRFAWENGRLPTSSEIGRMSVENLVMMVALSLAMAPFSSALRGIAEESAAAGREGTLARFQERYAGQFRTLDTERSQLQARLAERIEQNPAATQRDVADIQEQGADLDARMSALVDEASHDPVIDPEGLRAGLADATVRVGATPVPELFRSMGLDPSIRVESAGGDTYTVPPGTADELQSFAAEQNLPVAVEQVQGRPVLQISVAGRGRIAVVEQAEVSLSASGGGGSRRGSGTRSSTGAVTPPAPRPEPAEPAPAPTRPPGRTAAPPRPPHTWSEDYSQGQLERILDDPASGFRRSVHPSTGRPISEPGFREGQPMNMGRRQAKAARKLGGATFPDVYGTETATNRAQAMELKTVRTGDTVGSHFSRPEVSLKIIEQHGGRLANLPGGAESYLVVDIRQSGQTIGESLTDLSRVMRNYGGMGDARGLWTGVRFMTGSATAPTLSTVYVIP